MFIRHRNIFTLHIPKISEVLNGFSYMIVPEICSSLSLIGFPKEKVFQYTQNKFP